MVWVGGQVESVALREAKDIPRLSGEETKGVLWRRQRLQGSYMSYHLH